MEEVNIEKGIVDGTADAEKLEEIRLVSRR